MNFNRLLNTKLGVFFISIILGLGLATLFRKVCNDKSCIIFNGPIISDFEDKIYEYDAKPDRVVLNKFLNEIFTNP